MSAIGFLVLLVIAIIALMLLMTKVKLNPVMSLFVVALGFGVTLGIFGTEGYSFMETLTLITTGFGNTLGSLGMPIILGAVLAMGVQDTGAAKSIANFFIRLFRGKNLELAPSLTAYVVSIPVFGDITTILCSNIANVLGKRKHISMSTMASFTQTGLNLTHAMVPPTPGILAVSVALSADLGMVISWGIVITVITFFLTWRGNQGNLLRRGKRSDHQGQGSAQHLRFLPDYPDSRHPDRRRLLCWYADPRVHPRRRYGPHPGCHCQR